MNANIVFCILDYNHPENALRWYDYLKHKFDTYIINTNDKETQLDTFNLNDNHILRLGNIHFGGSLLTAYDLAIEKNSDWLIYVTSDVEISDDNINRFYSIFTSEVSNSTDIGVYGVSALYGSSVFSKNNACLYNVSNFTNYSDGCRDVNVIEDWFYACRTEFIKEVLEKYINREEICYGWGLCYLTTHIAHQQGFRIIVDDRVRIYHPQGTAYSRDAAENEYNIILAKLKDDDTSYINSTGIYIPELLYNFTFDGEEYWIPKDPCDKDKYIVCSCAKNEEPYLIEWIEHYLQLGFDKIIIFDNNDTERIVPLLHNYIVNEQVTVVDCHGVNAMQIPAYTQFMQAGNFKWCAFYDIDEFLEIPRFDNIKDFLNTVDDNIDVVAFNWMMYGFNGEVYNKPGTVQERFKTPLKPILYQKENVFIKSIVRGNHSKHEYSYFVSAHYIRNDIRDIVYSVGGYYTTINLAENVLPLRYKNGYLKHYYTKSLQEWYLKSQRGWPDGTQNLNLLNPIFYVQQNDFSVGNYLMGAFLRTTLTDAYNTDLVDAYDIFELKTSNDNFYSLMVYAAGRMSSKKGNTYVFYGSNIDDSLYVQLVELGIETGNNVLFVQSEDELWNIYLRYSKKENPTYYIVDCL